MKTFILPHISCEYTVCFGKGGGLEYSALHGEYVEVEHKYIPGARGLGRGRDVKKIPFALHGVFATSKLFYEKTNKFHPYNFYALFDFSRLAAEYPDIYQLVLLPDAPMVYYLPQEVLQLSMSGAIVQYLCNHMANGYMSDLISAVDQDLHGWIDVALDLRDEYPEITQKINAKIEGKILENMQSAGFQLMPHQGFPQRSELVIYKQASNIFVGSGYGGIALKQIIEMVEGGDA